MKLFDVDFTGETVDEEGETLHLGAINLDGFIEGFSASLSYWSKEDYHKQWLEAAVRLLQPDSRSAFITCMYDPQTANFIHWWPAWQVSNFVVVQQHLLSLDISLFDSMDEEIKALVSQFSMENPYAAVSDRLATHNKECQETGVCRHPRLGTQLAEGIDFCPSEWSVQLHDIEQFLNQRAADWKR
jgi:hypothetical protein